MDKKTKILLGFMIVATLVSVGYTFYKTVILGDFEVVNTEGDSATDTSSANSN